ncbi:MAG: hypothetical protein Q4F49_00935 [Pseudoxanthomonas suwonensis]|nr:hypothetical protein [Pseudoxanthomonas suwonensis]
MNALQWFDVVGLLGTTAVLLAYLLLQADRLPAHGVVYPLLNIAGAVGILVSLTGGFNLAVAILQLAWIAISLYGLARRRNKRPRHRSPPG